MVKKVLMILAPDGFRDEEYVEPRGVLQETAEIVTASSRTGELKGMMGGEAVAEVALDEVNPGEFDAVVFVGGVGAKVYFSDTRALMIARKAFEDGKIVAAICISPTILANAGILKGKRATVFSDQGLIDNLKAKGAEYSQDSVVRDGRIITASGPPVARRFGEEIKKALEE